jgi:flagellar basal-body rod protein FlgF
MDALIFTAMSGAERTLHAQQVHANNLANVETPGFRADLELSSAQAVPGYGYDDRHVTQLHADAVQSRPGAVRATGRELDVAVKGSGYLAVQYGNGEGYTRSGAIDVGADGALTIGGRPVLGDGGPIVLPAYQRVAIAADGTISIQAPGQAEMQVVDRLKRVDPKPADVTKNEAGLVVARDGATLPADDQVAVLGGHLEGSNVSAVEEMVSTMTLTRDFEVQMKLYKAADNMADSGNRLVGA